MEFLQSHDLNQLSLWTPLIGGVLLYIGLNIKITEVDPNKWTQYEDKKLKTLKKKLKWSKELLN